MIDESGWPEHDPHATAQDDNLGTDEVPMVTAAPRPVEDIERAAVALAAIDNADEAMFKGWWGRLPKQEKERYRRLAQES